MVLATRANTCWPSAAVHAVKVLVNVMDARLPPLHSKVAFKPFGIECGPALAVLAGCVEVGIARGEMGQTFPFQIAQMAHVTAVGIAGRDPAEAASTDTKCRERAVRQRVACRARPLRASPRACSSRYWL